MVTDVHSGGEMQNFEKGNAKRGDMESMRSYTEYMWESCQAIALSSSYIPSPQIMKDEKLLAIQREYSFLIDIAKSYISKIELIIPVGNAVIDICTDAGVVAFRLGRAPALEELGYVLGCIVEIREFGNTAINIALSNDSPTIVFGEEHFLDVLKEWASFCVPIHNMDGHVVGALNIVLPADYASKNILDLIIMAVRGIENELVFLEEKNKLMATNEVLSEYNHGVMRTASIVSHDIRNSLSTISAYVQLLQLQGILDNTKGDRILSEISRINKLLHNFRLLAEPLKFNLYRHPLRDLLNSIVYTFNAKANMAGINMELNLLVQDVFVMIDRELMERVFINIIMNAIQAMERKGGSLNISCSLGKLGDKVEITFEDTGPGIEEDKLEDIFKIFYTTKKEGNGLGLAMCQHIVKAHGGDILVESKKGKGTKFIIELPCIKVCNFE